MTFQAQQFIIAFFFRTYLHHLAWVLVVLLPAAIGILAAHHHDVAVFIKIIISIFIHSAITVIVYRYQARAGRAGVIGLMEEIVTRIGIDGRYNVEGLICQ